MANLEYKLIILSSILVIIGAINWGTIGLFNYNFVDRISVAFDTMAISRIVYILVGLAAIYLIWITYKERNLLRTLDMVF